VVYPPGSNWAAGERESASVCTQSGGVCLDPLGLAKEYGIGNKRKKPPETIIPATSYDNTRNIALAKVGRLMPGTRNPHIGKLGVGRCQTIEFKGKTMNGKPITCCAIL